MTLRPYSLLVTCIILLFAVSACGADDDAAPVADPQDQDGDVADFFSGQTIRMIVGFGAGGGFDLYTRTIASHIGEHIPGDPEVIVENMTGAGSLVAANHLYQDADNDGTVIGHFHGQLFLHRMLEIPEVDLEPDSFEILGAPAREVVACVVRQETGVTNLEELQDLDEPLAMGGTSPGDTNVDYPQLLQTEFGLPLEPAAGYDSVAEVAVAVEQGEVDGLCNSYEGMRVNLAEALDAGELIPIAQAGQVMHPGLEGVPQLSELAETDEARRLLDALGGASELMRVYVLPPDVPEERAAVLHDAFHATLTDEAFLADAEEAGLFIDPVPSQAYGEMLETLRALSDEQKDKLQAIVRPED